MIHVYTSKNDRLLYVHLMKLEPEMLTKYAQDIIPRLDDDEQCVRIEAIKALGKLEPEYAQDIIPKLDDELRTP